MLIETRQNSIYGYVLKGINIIINFNINRRYFKNGREEPRS